MSILKSTVKALFFCSLEQNSDSINLMSLDQQIRDAGHRVRAARKAVALAKGQHDQDCHQLTRTLANIADLEERTLSALEKKKEALAREAAGGSVPEFAQNQRLNDRPFQIFLFWTFWNTESAEYK